MVATNEKVFPTEEHLHIRFHCLHKLWTPEQGNAIATEYNWAASRFILCSYPAMYTMFHWSLQIHLSLWGCAAMV